MRPITELAVSLVIPVYNEEGALEQLFQRLDALLVQWDRSKRWEVVLVDDGSADGSRDLLAAKSERDPRYKLLGLSRNFGHQIAITAGLDRAEGEAVVVLDASADPTLALTPRGLKCGVHFRSPETIPSLAVSTNSGQAHRAADAQKASACTTAIGGLCSHQWQEALADLLRRLAALPTKPIQPLP